MIIDFHAHIYPSKIAEKATKSVGDFYDLNMDCNGSSESLVESGSKIGVSNYVVHSVATKPSQVESINNYILEQCKLFPQFIGFASIHPDYDNFEAELKRCKFEGMKGVKIHPDFQKFQVDSSVMDDIYDCISSLGLVLLVHAGDCRFDFSGPKRIANVLVNHPDLKLVAAHFGGFTEWDASCEYLLGKNVWFDTSSTLFKLPIEKADKMIREHGVEKMLFGSDFPMWNHEGEFERFNKLDLSDKEKEAVLYTNAKNLLNLS